MMMKANVGNHNEEEEDNDKNAGLLPLPLSSPSLTPIDGTMGEVVGKNIVAVVVVLATTTHNGDDGDSNDKEMTMGVVGGAEVMFIPDTAATAVVILDVHICMMPLLMLLY